MGEFLLDFDGLKVDDKSWTVWNWPQGVGLYGIYKNYRHTKSPKALKIVNDWFEERMLEGAPPKNVNTMAPLLTMAYLYEDETISVESSSFEKNFINIYPSHLTQNPK